MEKIETLHAGNFKIIQDTEKFRFGIDAVLLADYASAKLSPKTIHVVDLCTGNGIVPLLMTAKLLCRGRREQSVLGKPSAGAYEATGAEAAEAAANAGKAAICQPLSVRFTGVEIQHDAVDMAQRSVALNNLQNSIEIIECDIKNVFSVLSKNCADVVTVNPPYMPLAHGKKCPPAEMAIARHEMLCNLEDVVVAAAGLLNSNGLFYMIHRPERLAEIMESLVRNRLEPKRLRFVLPYAETAPTMVLVEAKKCAAHGLVVEKPLVVYSGKKIYSPEMEQIYGRAQ